LDKTCLRSLHHKAYKDQNLHNYNCFFLMKHL
jgi:hypothetical protein